MSVNNVLPTTSTPFKDRTQGSCNKITKNNFCCLTGPCKYYHDVTILMHSDGVSEQRELQRYCLKFTDADGGTMFLGEQNVKACSAYSPPFWSIEGWKRLVENHDWFTYAYKVKSPEIRVIPRNLGVFLAKKLFEIFKK